MRARCERGRRSDNRVNRGGSWNSNARNCRAANRNGNTPQNADDNLGFRLARAHGWAGWPSPDPTSIVTGGPCPGESRKGPGVEVEVADAPSNPRREPAFAARGGR